MKLLDSNEFVNSKNAKRLLTIDDDELLLLIGFGFTDPESIAKFHDMISKYDGKDKAIGRPKEISKQLRLRDVGGAISLLKIDINDVKKTEIVGDIDVSVPMGLCYRHEDRSLYVGSHESVIEIKQGKVSRHIYNNLFSDIHTIKRSSKGLYVVCTATDSIVEIDPNNPSKPLWDWLATEHGFTVAPNGETISIDRSICYKDIEGEGTRSHTTHINSVEGFGGNQLLATLFHQDLLIQINKDTGRYKKILGGFTNPHGIHKITNGYILSDTKGGRVLFMDNEFKVVKEIKGEFKWIQDSIEFKNYFLVADDNLATIFIYDKDLNKVDEIRWNHYMRKFSTMISITGKEAKDIFLEREYDRN